MTTPDRRYGGRVYYERGGQLSLAYPSFAAPQATLDVLLNPSYGDPHESETLPQGMVRTPTGRALASSVASAPVRAMRYSWGHMPEGWPQGQRISGTATLHAPTAQSASFGSLDWLVSIGFRSFDGLTPAALVVDELNSVGSTIDTHAFTVSTTDLTKYPQGLLRQLDLEFTSDAATEQLRVRAQSSGQDFLIADLHAIHATGDAFSGSDFVFDTLSDGIADGWTLASGSAAGCSHYGQDAAGLREWIREVCDGALKTFELRRPGDGLVVPVRLVDPLGQVGWPRGSAGSVAGVAITLEEVNP